MAQWWSTSLPRRGSRVRSPSRALANKKGYPSGYPFLLSRSALHFSNACCFAAWVRFLGALKRPSVVPVPRSTGPCATRLALFPSLTNRYSFPSLFHKPFPNDLSFPDIPAQKQLHHNSLFRILIISPL